MWDSVPFNVRLAERRALRAAEPEARRIVGQTVADSGASSRAAARIRANANIDETVRRVGNRSGSEERPMIGPA